MGARRSTMQHSSASSAYRVQRVLNSRNEEIHSRMVCRLRRAFDACPLGAQVSEPEAPALRSLTEAVRAAQREAGLKIARVTNMG